MSRGYIAATVAKPATAPAVAVSHCHCNSDISFKRKRRGALHKQKQDRPPIASRATVTSGSFYRGSKRNVYVINNKVKAVGPSAATLNGQAKDILSSYGYGSSHQEAKEPQSTPPTVSAQTQMFLFLNCRPNT